MINNMTCFPKLKISWRRGKQCTSPVTLGGRHNKDDAELIVQQHTKSSAQNNKEQPCPLSS